jgi:hypothetical protein
MSEQQQTAVEWLIANFPEISSYITLGASLQLHAKFQHALVMERQQIVEFADKYADYCYYASPNNRYVSPKTADQYYTETYGGNNEQGN